MLPKPTNVLLVEDSRLQCEVIRAALTKVGCKVEALPTGEEALQQYAPGRYQVLLLDVLLPGIDGLDVLSAVRKLDPFQCIILMTAEGTGISAADALRAGADDYLIKPIRMDDQGVELQATIERSVERSRLARENTLLHHEMADAKRLSAILALIAGTAHEMSQPLTVLVGTVALMLRDPNLNGHQQELELLQRASQRLGELARHLRGLVLESATLPALATITPPMEGAS